MLNRLLYLIKSLTHSVCDGCMLELKAPIQVYQTALYKATVHAAIAYGLTKQQYANWLLKAQTAHLKANKKFFWCESDLNKAMHFRTTGKKHLWKEILKLM